MSDEKPKGYKDLLISRKGIELVKSIYQLTQRFPPDERFGLTSQLRRSAVSVPCNIAEGQARHTTKEFIHFISNSEGSLAEVDTQVVIATELQYCTQKETEFVFGLIDELRRMLNGLRRRLQEKLR